MQIKSKVKSKQQGQQLKHKNEKCQGKYKDNHNPGNLGHPCGVTPKNNVIRTEVNLHKLQFPLDLLDAK